MAAPEYASEHDLRLSSRLKSAEYFYWTESGKPLWVLLNLDVVQQIEVEALSGFSALPRRGLEVGGILLGSVSSSKEGTRLVQVERAAPCDCEHLSGPSFVLSEKDRDALDKQLEGLSSSVGEDTVVGYYRSHTREGLHLDQEDSKLIQQYFTNEDSLFLLVKPHADRSSTGGFFIWENHTVRLSACYLEFPFRRKELMAGGYPIVRGSGEGTESSLELSARQGAPDHRSVGRSAGGVSRIGNQTKTDQRRADTKANPDYVTRADSAQLHPPSAKRRVLDKRGTGIAAVILLVGGLVICYSALHQPAKRTGLDSGSIIPRQTGNRAGAVRSTTEAPAAEQGALALSVERRGQGARVTWDHRSAVIEQAYSGLLTVSVGLGRRQIALTRDQLLDGSVMYYPTTNEVGFSLEVFAPTGSIRESVLLVDAPRVAQRQSTLRGTTSDKRAFISRGALAQNRIPAGRNHTGMQDTASVEQPAKSGPLVATKALGGSAATSRPEPSNSAREFQGIEIRPSYPSQLAGVQGERSIHTSVRSEAGVASPFHPVVTTEPQDESAVRRAIDKVPGLRLLLPHQNRAGADFTPAKPLRLVQPDIPHELQSKIAGSTLDVRATIWKDGTLEPERVLTKNVTRELTNLTLYATQESTFEPALIGKKPVSSRIVLHYRF